MYDVTHVRMIETRLCDQKFLKNGKGAITFGDVVGTGKKAGVGRDTPFLGELKEWRVECGT